jgi:hypothetical protein
MPPDNSGSLNARALLHAWCLDDVRIYNRALSPTEVQQLYNLGTVRITQ